MEILSGVFAGKTTGAPIALNFANGNTRSGDYSEFLAKPRPGHADIKWDGCNDPRGGGHFSGRITLPIVAAGVIAKKIMQGVSFKAELIEIGGCADSSLWQQMLREAAAEGDSLGGVVECRVEGHNDPITADGVSKNGAGGVNGGITNGAPLVFRVAFKPTASIAREQTTWNFEEGRMDSLKVKGRHDVCFALRTPVIVEAMAAIVLADLKLR